MQVKTKINTEEVAVETEEEEAPLAMVAIKDVSAVVAQAEVTIIPETKAEIKIGTRREIGNLMTREMILN